MCSASFQQKMCSQVITINLLGGNSKTYFPGAVIEGNVVLVLSKPELMKHLTIVLSGKGHVHWRSHRTEKRTSTLCEGTDPVFTHVSASDRFFEDMTVDLWGNGSSAKEMAVGKHEFPFHFQLPTDGRLPSSHESNFECCTAIGYIRYSLNATFDRPGLKSSLSTKVVINVREDTFDVKKPLLMRPLSKSKEKMLCCLWCTSGPLMLTATIDRGVYYPGESISITTEIENHSSRSLAGVVAKLKRRVSMSACDRSKDHTEDIVVIREAPSNWYNKPLPIPSGITPTINSCQVLTVSYVLSVELVMLFALEFDVEIPVMIASSVPYKEPPPEYEDTKDLIF